MKQKNRNIPKPHLVVIRWLPLALFAFMSNSVFSQSGSATIRGSVKDQNGQPIAAVTVLLNQMDGSFKKSITADNNGHFSINDLQSAAKYSLTLSAIGYTDYVQNAVPLVPGENALTFTLQQTTQNLNDVVVIGYGSMKKQDLSAAVASVPDIAQIKNRPVLDVASMMQGKVAGVSIVSNGGHPSAPPKITIRGIGSTNGENVLYVVDGVPGAPFNPNDVESITVLKDAASAAIYGAFSGSAGVILITTRQASKGNPSMEYEGFTGAKSAWKLPQSLTAAQEAMVSDLSLSNAGKDPLDGWDPAINPDAQVTRTDWIHSIFRTGVVQRHTLTLNAGTDKFSTLIQGRYENDEGTLLNTYNRNASLRFNTHYKFNDHIKFRQEVFWNNNDSRDAETSSGYSGVILSALYMPRSASVYYEDGSFGGVGPRDSKYLGIFGDAINPVATLLRNKPQNKTTSLLSVSELKVSGLLPGLDYTSRFSYKQSSQLYKLFTPARTEPGKPNEQNTLDYSTDKSYNWLWENTLNYTKKINRHSIGAMASVTGQETGSKGFSASANGITNEAEWAQSFLNASIFDKTLPGDYDIKDRNLSYVGRVSYSWADRYFFTGSYRYDMAGRLAEGFRGKGFPGITGAWKISSEPFFNIKGIDLLKIRASWGQIGNIGSIRYYYGYQTLSSNENYQIGDGSPLSTGLYLNQSFNQALSWETAQQTDIGLDLTLLNKRLNITADYFDKVTFDLIHEQALGWTSTYGINPPLINQGKVGNKGFEMAISWQDQTGDLGYQIGGNFATLKNKVLYIDSDPTSTWFHTDAWRGFLTPYRSTVGQPYYSYYLIKTAGIFQSDAEVAAYAKDGAPIQPFAKAGDLKFVDYNKDGVINDQDRVYMGNAFPKLSYGFTANLTWKNFDMSLFLQGVSGVKNFNAFKESTLNAAEQGYNRWNKILDAWSPTNTDSNIPIISANDANKNFGTASDWYLENGDYLRLKSLVIGYTVNMRNKNTSLRIYVSGDNLVTITKYSGMDPEVGGIGLDGGQFPISRIYSIGLKLKF